MSVNVGEGFHARDGWYFQRQDDGSVKISAAVSRSTETLTIPPNEWASIVAAVSAQGETAETYQAALSARCRWRGLLSSSMVPSRNPRNSLGSSPW